MIGPALLTAALIAEPLDAAEAKGRVAIQQYAECVAHKYRDLAVIVADLDPMQFSAKQRSEVHRPDCLTEVAESIAVDPTLYRFAVTEVFVRRKSGKIAPDISSAAPVAHPIRAADAPPPADWVSSGGLLSRWPEARERERRFSVVSALGDCVVRANPAGSWTVLGTKITSDAEKGAMAALAPTIGTCLPAGQQMSLSKVDIRGMIALNFYLLSKAPRVAAGAVH